PSPPRPMTRPGREVLMRMRIAFCARSISTEVTYMPRRRFLRKRRIAESTITFVRYSSGVLANQRDFQSRMTPRRCAYGCTVCVILFSFSFGFGLLSAGLLLRDVRAELKRNDGHGLSDGAGAAASERA